MSREVARWGPLLARVLKHQKKLHGGRHVPISVPMGLALVEHESGGNKDIVNPSTGDAFGLTQFLHSTAASYGVKEHDARSQLRGMVRYLYDLRKGGMSLQEALDHHYGGAGADGYYADLKGRAQKYQSFHGAQRRAPGGGGGRRRRAGGSPGHMTKGKYFPGHGAQSQKITGLRLGNKVQFDKQGYQEANKEFILGQLLSKNPANADNPLLKLGVLPSVAPSEGEFMKNVLTTHKTSRTVKVPGTGVGGVRGPGHFVGGHGGKGGRGRGGKALRFGKVDYASTANLPGKPVHSNMQHVLKLIAGGTGNHLYVGTGTNHDMMTTNGTVSDHYSGHATDVTMANGKPMVGRNLNHVGNQTLRWFEHHGAKIESVLGGSKSSSKHWNRGLFNLDWVNPRTKHHYRVQVIFGTNSAALGGNHTNHMHVGIEKR